MKILSLLLGWVPTIFNLIFRALGIHDKTKKALVVSIAVNFLLAVPAGLFSWGVWQKYQYARKNNLPPQYALPSPAARTGAGLAAGPPSRVGSGEGHDHRVAPAAPVEAGEAP